MFFSHNSGSRYARKSIKGCDDADDSLVSKNKLDPKMARWVGAQGQVKLAKKAKTCPHCDVTYRKPQTQIKKFFNRN